MKKVYKTPASELIRVTVEPMLAVTTAHGRAVHEKCLKARAGSMDLTGRVAHVDGPASDHSAPDGLDAASVTSDERV